MLEIQKTFDVEVAHILELNRPSKCRHLHGHSASVTVFTDGAINHEGMLVDYTAFPKDLVMALDHKTLLAERHVTEISDEQVNAVIGDVAVSGPPESFYIMPGIENTTAEEIARFIFNKLKESGFPVSGIQYSESASTCATYLEEE